MSLRAEKVYTIAEARQKFSEGVVIDFRSQQLPEDFGPRLKQVISPHRALSDGCPIAILYAREEAEARISLGEDWRVQANDDLLASLNEAFFGCARLDYTGT